MAVDRTLEPPVPARALKAPRSGARPALGELEASLGHSFTDKALLKQALTHVSSAAGGKRALTNERLEFLGDRVLGMAIAEWLFAHFPDAREGEMSRRLADIVRKETCAAVAREWKVGPHLYLGSSESGSGGRSKVAILGDACEALIGAVCIDAGYEAGRAVVWRGFAGRIRDPGPPSADPKTVLQEWAQARGHSLPSYIETSRSGPDHQPEFVISVEVGGFTPCEASGASKRLGEQAAARAFLEREGVLAGPGKTKTGTGA